MNNTSCIVTVIKNEHEYLDEWIKYHLDLGINRIFIFEDIGSNSHKNITDKYGENVRLSSILSVLDDSGKEEAFSLKKNKVYNPQHLYFRFALMAVKLTYKDLYDWCFVIDADEFITLEYENNKITDILNLYRSYDAFIMKWKVYGANGYIEKPNYNDKGVVDTYTKEAEGKVPDNPDSLVKTCYNLNTYEDDFFINQHYPSDEANWVNTKFIKDGISSTYKNIYIRHYITKSLEEYKWKLNERGFIMGNNRKLENFYIINPDMNDEETLIVLPYAQKYSQGNELKLCLKAWKKYCTFKYHFAVVGEFDKSIVSEFPWVDFVECPEIELKEGQYNSHLDQQHRFEVAMEKFGDKYDGFIRMMDDIYAVRPFTLKDVKTVHCIRGKCYGDKNYPVCSWKYDRWKTKMLLEKENLPCVNYATHYPQFFDFSRLKYLWDRYNMREESYSYEDLYFNYFNHLEPEFTHMIRFKNGNNEKYKLGLMEVINNPSIIFINNAAEGWTEWLEKEIEKILEKKLCTEIQHKPIVTKESTHTNDELVVMPYVQRYSQGNELKLCLKAWKKFCTFKYHFVVIGEFDDSLANEFPWVDFISFPSITTTDKQYRPHLDIQMKMESIMRIYGTKYNGFIRVSDDIYPVRPFFLEDITTVHYRYDEIYGDKNMPNNTFIKDKWKTKNLLKEESLPTVDYTIHYPYYYEFFKLKEIWDKFDMRSESYVLEDIYFNYFHHNDAILNEVNGYFVNEPLAFSVDNFKNSLKNKNIKFIGNSTFGWCEELETELLKIIEETV